VAGFNNNRKKLMLGLSLSLSMISLGFMYAKWPQRKAAVSPEQQFLLRVNAQKRFPSMPLLMRSGMQQEYDFLSATLSNSVSLDERKMNALSTSAGRMDNLARELFSYERDLRAANKPREDVQFFREHAFTLGQLSQDMQEAALRQDTAHMNAAVKQMAQACSECHLRFQVKLADGSKAKPVQR